MSAQKPSVGRIVHAIVDPTLNNGTDVAPAVITRVWSDEMVNCRVLYDGRSSPAWETSVPLYDDEQSARAADTNGVTRACFWPPRV